jgi:hypothetical protein
MWNFIALLASMAIQYATRAKPQNARPPGINDIERPSIKDGQELTVLFGRGKFKGHTAWYGDMRTTPIKKRV